MKPKQEAKELVEKFNIFCNQCDELEGKGWVCISMQKQCASICVDEIIKETRENEGFKDRIEYWQEVKQEINAL